MTTHPVPRPPAHPTRAVQVHDDTRALPDILPGHRFVLGSRLDPATHHQAYRWQCTCSTPTSGLDSPQPAGHWHTGIVSTNAIVRSYIEDHLWPLITTALRHAITP